MLYYEKALLIAVILIAIVTAVNHYVYGERNHKNFVPMYEDQIIVFNINGVGKIINIDDYLTDEGIERLQMELDNDIDTFSLSDLTK